jgi:hypothetical protein
MAWLRAAWGVEPVMAWRRVGVDLIGRVDAKQTSDERKRSSARPEADTLRAAQIAESEARRKRGRSVKCLRSARAGRHGSAAATEVTVALAIRLGDAGCRRRRRMHSVERMCPVRGPGKVKGKARHQARRAAVPRRPRGDPPARTACSTTGPRDRASALRRPTAKADANGLVPGSVTSGTAWRG